MTSDPKFQQAATSFYSDDSGSDQSENDGDWSTGSDVLELDEVDDDTFDSYFTEQIEKLQSEPSTNAANLSPAKSDGASDDSSVVEGYTAPISVPANPKKQYTIEEAWARQAYFNGTRKSKARSSTEYRFVYSRFHCDQCCEFGSTCVPIGDDRYFKDCLRTKWFDTEFITGFCSLLAHDAHMEAPPFMTASNRAKMVYCPYPKAQVFEQNVKSYDNFFTHFVLIAISSSHFAVLE